MLKARVALQLDACQVRTAPPPPSVAVFYKAYAYRCLGLPSIKAAILGHSCRAGSPISAQVCEKRPWHDGLTSTPN